MNEVRKSSRKLFLLYEKFYSENPDFSKEDVRRKAMAMVYLLWEHSIYLPIPTSFLLSKSYLSPVWSNDVLSLFSDAFLLSKKDFQLMEEEGTYWSIQFAELIGIIGSYFFPLNEPLFMENVATMLFLRKHSLENVSIDTIIQSKYVSCSYDEILVIWDFLDYLDVLRDYICGIGSSAKYSGVIQNIEEEIDTIFENVELILKRKKQKEETN